MIGGCQSSTSLLSTWPYCETVSYIAMPGQNRVASAAISSASEPPAIQLALPEPRGSNSATRRLAWASYLRGLEFLTRQSVHRIEPLCRNFDDESATWAQNPVRLL